MVQGKRFTQFIYQIIQLYNSKPWEVLIMVFDDSEVDFNCIKANSSEKSVTNTHAFFFR